MSRGGLSIYGQGFYDPHADEAIIPARENETKRLTIDFGSAPTGVTKAESGISATTPTTSGNTITTTLSGIVDNGYVDFQATIGGEVRKVRVRGRSADQQDGYGG